MVSRLLSISWVAMLLALHAATAECKNSSVLQTANRRLLQSEALSAVQPRLDLHDIDSMDETEPYRVMMLLAWQQLTTSPKRSTPFSYWQLAGVHGKSWAYNGVDAPAAGFCRHQVPGFGPWHRAYLRQFELALIGAAKAAASRFQEPQLRSQFEGLAEAIRLPYWDWTNPNVPKLLTSRQVTVLNFVTGVPTTIQNPLGVYEFVAGAGDGRNAGQTINRGLTWSQVMSHSARRFGMEMASFLRSNTWRCTYLTGIGCTGNLESTHNEIHNVLGGFKGEMATLFYASFDPLFWLHHSMVDRVLWLFQNNGGLWVGSHRYSPFLNLEGDAAEISSYGYSYGPARGSTINIGGRRSRSATWRPSTRSNDVFTKIGSTAGKVAVRSALEQWTENYNGFTWAVRFQNFSQYQMDEPVHLLVYLKGPSIQALPAKFEDLNELRMKPNYCGSIAGFNQHVHVHSEEGGKTISRAVDLTHCLKEAGVDPDVPAINPANHALGPAKVPVHLSDLKIVAITASGKDVTDTYDMGKTVISWSSPTTRTAAEVHALAGADPIEAQAFAHPLAFSADEQVLSMVVGDAAV